ncbi:MAG: hypothetical protein ACP6IP_05565 [Candidatus Njordarchaeia archaeon]
MDLILVGFLIVLIAVLMFLVAFFKLERFRKYRIRFRILYNQGYAYFKHFYYMGKYIIRLTELIKTFIAIGIVIGILFLLALYIIGLYNTYLAPAYNLPTVKIDLKRFSPIFIIGWLGGMLVNVFLKPKLERFADRVSAKPLMVYVFGSNEMTRHLVNNLIELGLGPMTALIAEKSLYWIEALGAKLDLLILDNPEELKVETLYERIKFKNALRIVILVENRELSQHILVNVRKVNPDAEIIILSQYKPPIIDLAGSYAYNIRVINDIETITNEIIRRLALGFDYAPVIEAEVPSEYFDKPTSAIEEDFNYKVKVLGIKRGEDIILTDKFRKGDRALLYLKNKKALREFLALIPRKFGEEEEKPEAEVDKTEEEIEKKLEKEEEKPETKEPSSLLEKLKK